MTPEMTPEMLAEMLAELDRLRDIRLPDPVGWWPLAPGWWALGALICIATLAAWLLEARRRRGLRHLSLRELAGLRDRLHNDASHEDIGATLAVLLRRVALGAHRKSIATLSGEAWARELTTGKAALSPEVASYLADAPSAAIRHSDDIRPMLARALAEAERWIRGQS